MFLNRLRKIRVRIAERRIKEFIKNFWYRWLEKRRKVKSKIIYDFLKYKVQNQGKIEIKSMKYFKLMEKLQKRIRRFLIKRLIKYWIINHQWTIYEKEYQKSIGLHHPPQKSAEEKALEHQVRKLYMREYTKYAKLKYLKEHSLWKHRWETLTHQHNLSLTKLNAVKVLKQLPLIRTKPSLPPEPVDKIFIPQSKLKEMAKEVHDMKSQWEHMVSGIIKGPLLKKYSQNFLIGCRQL